MIFGNIFLVIVGTFGLIFSVVVILETIGKSIRRGKRKG